MEDITTDSADTLRDTLERHGVAILPGVLKETEINDMRKGIFDTLFHLTQDWKEPIQQLKPKSWKNFSNLKPRHGMLLQHWGIGHAQYLWDLRQNPNIVNIFATLWETSNLLVSFDGTSIAFPYETTKHTDAIFNGKPKYHLDQRLCDPSFQCVQSWVTAWDVHPGDATLTVLQGSHKYFSTFSETFNYQGKNIDWHQLKDHEIQWFLDQGCVMKDIVCPAGSMVFWDSRTTHSGKPALQNRQQRSSRGVAYLCYTPRPTTRCTTGDNIDSIMTHKKQMFDSGDTSSHWPHKPEPFPWTPKKCDTKVRRLPVPVLTPLGRRLAGLEEEEENENDVE